MEAICSPIVTEPSNLPDGELPTPDAMFICLQLPHAWAVNHALHWWNLLAEVRTPLDRQWSLECCMWRLFGLSELPWEHSKRPVAT